MFVTIPTLQSNIWLGNKTTAHILKIVKLRQETDAVSATSGLPDLKTMNSCQHGRYFYLIIIANCT